MPVRSANFDLIFFLCFLYLVFGARGQEPPIFESHDVPASTAIWVSTNECVRNSVSDRRWIGLHRDFGPDGLYGYLSHSSICFLPRFWTLYFLVDSEVHPKPKNWFEKNTKIETIWPLDTLGSRTACDFPSIQSAPKHPVRSSILPNVSLRNTFWRKTVFLYLAHMVRNSLNYAAKSWFF